MSKETTPSGTTFLGANPELLLAKRGGRVRPHQLAGAAGRCVNYCASLSHSIAAKFQTLLPTIRSEWIS